MAKTRVAGTVILMILALAAIVGCDLMAPQEPQVTHWAPALSPDGQSIVYASSTENGLALFRLDLATSREDQLTFNDAPNWSPQWSPDGTRVVYTSRREENVDLYILVLETMETLRLTTDAADDINPHWGSDGLVYFNSNRSGDWEIHAIDPLTSVMRQLTSRETAP